MATWFVYGVTKAGLYDRRPPQLANESADDFELEIGARDALLELWGGRRSRYGTRAFFLNSWLLSTLGPGGPSRGRRYLNCA